MSKNSRSIAGVRVTVTNVLKSGVYDLASYVGRILARRAGGSLFVLNEDVYDEQQGITYYEGTVTRKTPYGDQRIATIRFPITDDEQDWFRRVTELWLWVEGFSRKVC